MAITTHTLLVSLQLNAVTPVDGAECLLSSEEWDLITGAKRDSPSWLKVNNLVLDVPATERHCSQKVASELR